MHRVFRVSNTVSLCAVFPISYEKELDIDNKLHNYLKINVFRPQKTLKKT